MGYTVQELIISGKIGILIITVDKTLKTGEYIIEEGLRFSSTYENKLTINNIETDDEINVIIRISPNVKVSFFKTSISNKVNLCDICDVNIFDSKVTFECLYVENTIKISLGQNFLFEADKIISKNLDCVIWSSIFKVNNILVGNFTLTGNDTAITIGDLTVTDSSIFLSGDFSTSFYSISAKELYLYLNYNYSVSIIDTFNCDTFKLDLSNNSSFKSESGNVERFIFEVLNNSIVETNFKVKNIEKREINNGSIVNINKYHVIEKSMFNYKILLTGAIILTTAIVLARRYSM